MVGDARAEILPVADPRPVTEGRWSIGQRAYLITLVSLLLAGGVKFLLEPPSDARAPFLLLLGVVMASAWYGGLLQGLATTLLAALVGDYLFVPASSSFTAGDTGGAIRGPVRADFFWGFGAEAGAQAGRMRQALRMWVLLPKGYALPAN